ncbi:iron-sulfur cluster insertion protein [Clostridium cavendishii DSM 21758]|uniref:Iron-sulfur cluster insertion protein n=1 Tax=Clostridium cavendishii DSM 21758 TaxID=1121302 RepID=A0A1M6PNX9_9CLOT|nr:adhesin [Clostridium cavendishii]SHK09639.1 iron-sulfur cluster insertion protein [Clostridium cavendishii DSM 21758]
MKIAIADDTLEILQEMLKEQNTEAIRIAKAGPGCGGITVKIIADKITDNDEIVEDKGIKIVADKSISFFFTDATISHTRGLYGPILKLK